VKKITKEMLQSHGACADQLDNFSAMFPDGAEVTVENCEAVSSEFDWSCTAALLPCASARAEYDRASASARAEYDRASASAFDEYARACASAMDQCRRMRARTFARLYLAQ